MFSKAGLKRGLGMVFVLIGCPLLAYLCRVETQEMLLLAALTGALGFLTGLYVCEIA